MTPDRLATLARAMGYTVTMDDSGGYGVVRVMVDADVAGRPAKGWYALKSVFNPLDDYKQAFEVLAWVCSHETYDTWNICLDHNSGFLLSNEFKHNGTPEGIRNAIVEAAVRVAESIKPIRHPRETAMAQDATCGMLEVRNG